MADTVTWDLQERLDFIGLGQGERQHLRDIAPVIAEAVGPALDGFYTRVRATPQTRRFFSDVAQMDAAGRRQKDHWALIMKAEYGPGYMEAVRAVGSVHARIGLEPRWYIGGYAHVVEHLVRAMIAKATPASRRSLFGRDMPGWPTAALADQISALVKAAMLDMEMAVSVYLERLDARRLEAEAQQAEALDAMAAALEKLAGGDLCVRVDASLSEKSERLVESFNRAVESLREVIASVREASGRVRDGSAEIAGAADSASRQCEKQAAALEQTAAAIGELKTAIQATVTGAEGASRAVVEIRSKSDSSATVARRTVEAMSEIDSSSQKVSRIIGVIDEIAFQTNLLALNAGVEAARAGEAGKGFAVVASEVRALAQRSADAAKEIASLIQLSSQQVSDGVRLVGETEEWLSAIAGEMQRIEELVSGIALSARHQAGGINEISAAIGQIDDATQRNAAMIEENSAASASLAGEAATLTEIVHRFRDGAGSSDMQDTAPGGHAVHRLARAVGA